MPRGTCLVNTSRGEVVNEQAVVDALVSGHLGGYATDVLTDEDFTTLHSNPLWIIASQGHNVLITPHIGGCTINAMHATELIMARSFAELIL